MGDMSGLLFQMKFIAKQFGKSSKKCEKEEKAEKKKVKSALEKGNNEGAKIYAQNAIRKKHEALNYLRLQSRIDAVCSRLDTAIKMKQVTKGIQASVKGMDKVLQTMNVEKISQMMERFESQFDTLDITSGYMQDAIGQSTALTTPADDVNDLIAQIADEHNLELSEEIAGVGVKKTPLQDTSALDLDDLQRRMEKLKNPDA